MWQKYIPLNEILFCNSFHLVIFMRVPSALQAGYLDACCFSDAGAVC